MVRNLALAFAGALLTMATANRAGAAPGEDDAAALQAKGERLAKDGRYSEAIDAFKAADRLERRASHACLIALAYTRRELWPQAEIFLDLCHQRANAGDPLPAWVPTADEQIQKRLASANVAPVEIRTDPAQPNVELTVSSFAPDEVFAPRTIHLPPGHHVVIARAPGFEPSQRAIDVTDRTPMHVVIHLSRAGEAGAKPAVPAAPPPTQSSGGALPWILAGAGGATIALGVFVHVGPLRTTYNHLRDAQDLAEYGRYSTSYDRWRVATLGLYAAGTAVLVTGIVLHFRHRGHEAPPVAVSAAPLEGGGFLSFSWQR